jgi:hypothetical protein
MNQFSSADGQLLVGGIPLEQLAARTGQTPFYAYDRQQLLKTRCRTARGPSEFGQAALRDEGQPDAGADRCLMAGWSMASTSPRPAN